MEKENIIRQMGQYMTENMQMIRRMGMEFIQIKMEISRKENIKKVKWREKEE
jgi:hypothetical protein